MLLYSDGAAIHVSDSLSGPHGALRAALQGAKESHWKPEPTRQIRLRARRSEQAKKEIIPGRKKKVCVVKCVLSAVRSKA